MSNLAMKWPLRGDRSFPAQKRMRESPVGALVVTWALLVFLASVSMKVLKRKDEQAILGRCQGEAVRHQYL